MTRLYWSVSGEDERQKLRVCGKSHVEGGTVVWPNGADLCPDVLIWGGAPPEEGQQPAHPPQA
ncbi:hypothetical protein [Candidatus Binatus sp.]|uniref:hypothetical protein n=1 Tax=Candidatus Binatus sp. TaxID=2811406 RepID=UPI002F91C62A